MKNFELKCKCALAWDTETRVQLSAIEKQNNFALPESTLFKQKKKIDPVPL